MLIVSYDFRVDSLAKNCLEKNKSVVLLCHWLVASATASPPKANTRSSRGGYIEKMQGVGWMFSSGFGRERERERASGTALGDLA